MPNILNGIELVSSRLADEDGIPYGVKHVGNKPRVSSLPYLYDIAEGNVAGHEKFHVVGYNGDVDAALEDLRYNGGTWDFPTVGIQMEVVSSDAQDTGVVIKSGTSESVTLAASTDDSSIITLTDDDADFTAATAVAAGDGVLLDGDVRGGSVMTVAAHVLTFRVWGAFTPTSIQAYRVIDASAGGTGAQVVIVHGLNGSYEEIEEFVVTNGLTAVPTVSTDILRINRFISGRCGSTNAAVGKVDIRNLADTPIYRSIIAGFNEDVGALLTVPTGKTAYISKWTISAANKTAGRPAEAWLRVTCDENGYYTGKKFHIKDIALVQDGGAVVVFTVPVKIPSRSDIKITVQCPETNAIMAGHIEGWME